jgi:hypothetical protein
MLVYTYLFYVVLSLGLTIWVARTLFHNGRIFLVDVFAGNEELADSVNRLLVVGFYLINLGYVCLALRVTDTVMKGSDAIEALSWKIGLVLVVLGGMHFLNLYIFSRIRRSAKLPSAPPPIRPDGFLSEPDAVS